MSQRQVDESLNMGTRGLLGSPLDIGTKGKVLGWEIYVVDIIHLYSDFLAEASLSSDFIGTIELVSDFLTKIPLTSTFENKIVLYSEIISNVEEITLQLESTFKKDITLVSDFNSKVELESTFTKKITLISDFDEDLGLESDIGLIE